MYVPAVVGVEATDREREGFKLRLDDWQQVRLRELFAGGYDFPLGHAVHEDVVDPFHPVLIALVHAVDSEVAWSRRRGRTG